jgi:uncharacterized protein
VRVLEPWYANVGKPLVKSPKVYIRDSGLLHTLLGIGDRPQLEGHPVVGGSWEGFVIEQLLVGLTVKMVLRRHVPTVPRSISLRNEERIEE